MLFKAKPLYAVSINDILVRFNHLWDFETSDSVIIEALMSKDSVIKETWKEEKTETNKKWKPTIKELRVTYFNKFWTKPFGAWDYDTIEAKIQE
jgi:hypothetical protein